MLWVLEITILSTSIIEVHRSPKTRSSIIVKEGGNGGTHQSRIQIPLLEPWLQAPTNTMVSTMYVQTTITRSPPLQEMPVWLLPLWLSQVIRVLGLTKTPCSLLFRRCLQLHRRPRRLGNLDILLGWFGLIVFGISTL